MAYLMIALFRAKGLPSNMALTRGVYVSVDYHGEQVAHYCAAVLIKGKVKGGYKRFGTDKKFREETLAAFGVADSGDWHLFLVDSSYQNFDAQHKIVEILTDQQARSDYGHYKFWDSFDSKFSRPKREAELEKRLKANPKDAGAWVELGDYYYGGNSQSH